jgi:glutathione reductase (NADPH)
MERKLDVLVVGAGTGGQTAAHDLRDRGLEVGVADASGRPGGVCALAGCQAKKWFYEATETIARASHLAGKGVDAPPTPDWAAILARKNAFTDTVPDRTVHSLMEAGIDWLPGRAEFLDADTVVVDGTPVAARHVVLATGARPAPLPIEGAEHLVTSDAFLDLPALPPRVVFVGGGFISLEFAHFAARLGATPGEIHVLEAAHRPLMPFDREMVELLVRASESEGIRIRADVRIDAIRRRGDTYAVHLATGEVLSADLVVLGAGRTPNVEGLGLGRAGVEHDRRGILVDGAMRTTNPRILAIGDVAATIQLARVADQEAHVAAATVAVEVGRAKNAVPIDYGTVPAVLFTYPQLGMVGRTEDGLRDEGVPYRRAFGTRLRWPTYRRLEMEHAAYKILVGEDGRLLGAHVLSDSAAGIVNAVRIAMRAGTTVETLHRESVLSPYPSRESDLTYMLAPLVA